MRKKSVHGAFTMVHRSTGSIEPPVGSGSTRCVGGRSNPCRYRCASSEGPKAKRLGIRPRPVGPIFFGGGFMVVDVIPQGSVFVPNLRYGEEGEYCRRQEGPVVPFEVKYVESG